MGCMLVSLGLYTSLVESTASFYRLVLRKGSNRGSFSIYNVKDILLYTGVSGLVKKTAVCSN